MNDILAVYRGPFKNRYGFIRGATYLLKIHNTTKQGLGFLTVMPHTLDGEVVSGPLQYWNPIDLGQNWMPLEFYDEDKEKELEEETRRMKEEYDTRIIFNFKEEE